MGETAAELMQEFILERNRQASSAGFAAGCEAGRSQGRRQAWTEAARWCSDRAAQLRHRGERSSASILDDAANHFKARASSKPAPP